MSTSLNITRTNGNVARTVPGEDHISGFMAYMVEAEIPESFKSSPIQALSTIEAAEAAGISADATSWTVRTVHYQLSEIFRINPAISLYVGLFAKPSTSTAPDFAEIKTMQNYTGGRLRQVGVWYGDRTLAEDDLTKLQGVGDALEGQFAELSILYAPKVASVKTIGKAMRGAKKSRVSVVIGQAGSGTGAELYSTGNAAKTSVSMLGVVLGLVSRAKVHQSIAWVKEFPTGISLPAFGDGTLLRALDAADVEALDTAGYLFAVTKPGQAGSYMNDSHTMDAAISDYCSIEAVRTMDKACRGVRSYLIPELGGNVYVDPTSGKLASYTVAHLESVANYALEEMEKAGELSGYKAEIDPGQDVAASGTVDVVIRNVAVPVMRHVRIKIGFAKSV